MCLVLEPVLYPETGFWDEAGFCANLVLERSRKQFCVLENRSEAGVFVC